MLFNVIRNFVRSRIARNYSKAFATTFLEALDEVDELNLTLKFQQDLADCQNKNPSVIKRDIEGKRVWELYKSSNGNVYAYFPDTFERRIYVSI